MRLLFISNYFPPEVNAPATRLYEHAKHWVKEGEVDVIAAVPNFPEGVVYEGYENRFTQGEVDGIRLTRVPMYIAENKGTLQRTASYISFMLSAIWYSRKVKGRPDVVVASSPQFFSGLAGYVISRLKRAPFVLEVRDLWPDSIVAVGAMRRNLIIRFFEVLERFLYRKADHIIVVTNSFKRIIADKGICEQKITVLKNGADLEAFSRPLDEQVLSDIRRRYDLDGKFVASYIGTIGMAHRADIMLEAAEQCSDPEIVFMVMGAGAERESLAARQAKLQLSNFRLIEKQPKSLVPYFLELTDACVVHLRDSPLFRTVIPSKIFEAMVARRPIVLGIRGETAEIVEEAGAGICVEPEDAAAVVEAVARLRRNRDEYRSMADSGFKYVFENHDRKRLANRYWNLLAQVADGKLLGSDAPNTIDYQTRQA